METYSHSGKVPLTGLLLGTLVGGGTACVLGFIYSFLIVYIPLIYVNFLIAGGFGAVVGFAVGWSAVVGKIRNNFFVAAFGLLFGAVGLYVAWGTDILARGELEDIGQIGFLAYKPAIILDYMKFFYENGFWGLRGNVMVSGVFLGIIWVLEALLILGAATLVAFGTVTEKPFCEFCNQWTDEEKDIRRLVLSDAAQQSHLERASQGDVAALGELTIAPPNAGLFLRVDAATCGGCAESTYLTLQMVEHGIDKEGKPEVTETALVTNLHVTNDDVTFARAAGREPPAEEETAESIPTSSDVDDEAQPEDFNFDKS